MIAIKGIASINVIIIVVEISGIVDDGEGSGEFVDCGVDVGVLVELARGVGLVVVAVPRLTFTVWML